MRNFSSTGLKNKKSERIFQQVNKVNQPPKSKQVNTGSSEKSNSDAVRPNTRKSAENFASLNSMRVETAEEDVKSEEELQKEEARRERLENTVNEAEKVRHRKILKNVFLWSGIVTILGGFLMGRPRENEVPIEGESFLKGYIRRIGESLTTSYDSAAAPAFGEKLLPDPLPEPFHRAHTLVIELNDSLVHLVWDKEIGWRIATRPGVKKFLAYLSKYYEIVIFADTPANIAQPVVEALDPYQMALYKLFRESTRLVKNKMVKDLSALNRDLSKVICVDVNPDAYSLQPENGIPLKKWVGEKSDRELLRLMTMLEELAIFMTYLKLEDVRPILNKLRSINAEDLPLAWETHKAQSKAAFQAQYGKAGATPKLGLFAQKQSGMKDVFTLIEGTNMNNKIFITLFVAYAKEERAYFEKEQVENLIAMKKARDEQIEEQKKMIEDMKAKKVKMFDLMFAYRLNFFQDNPTAVKSRESK
ncbi:mitochondrial inner membrane protein required for protein import [Clydaea vesicula]|uniref:Mitochondrial import inner membrane translocase subunit TIM50 n=1 Tax=Clydaea vesicula TaxID=447962 RepID=A0AAD5UB76_9FUNG|nr:mitochondrial inner membrane protein required for protein import [Clydaea vesicula]